MVIIFSVKRHAFHANLMQRLVCDRACLNGGSGSIWQIVYLAIGASANCVSELPAGCS